MRIHTYGNKRAPIVILLPGSFCNADTMANIIAELKTEFHLLAVDYNGQYAGCEKPFSSRRGEAENSISQADWILVLDRGRIAEEGTYGELTARNGLFSRMIETQERMSGGWNPEKEAER